MKNKIGTIYIIKNKINNKLYVGQTGNWGQRFIGHKSGKLYIDYAMRKNGYENFEFYFFNDIPIQLWDYFEKTLIKQLNSTSPNGYNLDSGGSKQKTRHLDTCEKISKSNTGKIRTEEVKEKNRQARLGKNLGKDNPNYGNHKFSGKNSSLYGIPKTEEHKKHLSENHADFSGENHPFYGKHHSEEFKKLQSKKMKGKNNVRSKPIICLNTLEVFECIANSALNKNISNSHIGSCCQGKRKSSGKDINNNPLHWLYYSDYQKLLKGEFTFKQIYDQYKKIEVLT